MQSDDRKTSVGAHHKVRELNKLFASEASQSNFWNSQIQKHLLGILFPHTRHTLGDLGGWRALYDLSLKESGRDHSIYFERSKLSPQSKALLNSRPITALSNDWNECTYLSPRHFPIGVPITRFPETNLSYVSIWYSCRVATLAVDPANSSGKLVQRLF